MLAQSTDQPLADFLASDANSAAADDFVGAALRAVRAHLGMDIAFVSEFIAGRRYFRHIDSAARHSPIAVGQSDPFEQGYCKFVVDGVLPQLIPNTADVPIAAAMPVTAAFPIGAHLSVPIRLADGTVYGTFCCFSHAPDASLNARDLQTITAFANLVAYRIDADLRAAALRRERVARVRRLFDDGVLSIVYQPIVDLVRRAPVGFECLARFAAEPMQGPDKWFSEAADMGLGIELELAAVTAAVQDFMSIPGDCYLSVNVSPAAVMSGKLGAALAAGIAQRIVIEVTEHAAVADYEQLQQALEPLRAQGMRLAIDDVGAGFASMRHVLNLKPDLLKLDVSLTRNVDGDAGRLAMAAALVTFAERTGCKVVAEGVETAAELDALRTVGVPFGQGYFLGRPAARAERGPYDDGRPASSAAAVVHA